MNATNPESPKLAGTPAPDHAVKGSPSRLEQHLLEIFQDVWDNFVDPAEALYDVDGTRWAAVGAGHGGGASGVPFATEPQLA